MALLYATAYAEDLQVCALVKRALEQLGTRAFLSPPTAPYAKPGGLYLGNQRIDVLYRFFPCEYMDGQRNLDAIVNALEAGQVRTLSSFSHIFLQSKVALARAHARARTLPHLERTTLGAHLPETFEFTRVDRDDLLAGRERWVLKRGLGRVGDEVFVGPLYDRHAWSRLVHHITLRQRQGEAWVAQRFVPQTPIATDAGERFLTLGVYLLEGEFVGYFARLTAKSHVSHDAVCVPVFFERGGP